MNITPNTTPNASTKLSTKLSTRADDTVKNLACVLWPSFLVAGIAVGVFFTMVDPQELYLFGEPVHFSKIATYSVGFFCFWALCAASSGLSLWLQRSAAQVNPPGK